MRTVGIIAEYNPFHNGHAYQIQKAKELARADCAVVAMSGNFVQRGAPSIIDKWKRAAMALHGGADAVFELPVCLATASAEYFALAGIALFDALGCVSDVCFGCETPNLPLMQDAAALLADEPEQYQKCLSYALKRGLSYPAARTKAVTFCMGSMPKSAQNDLASLFLEPNNILALEYLKAIRRLRSRIQPLPLLRQGSEYHSTGLTDRFCSAAAIRTILHSEQDFAKRLADFAPNETLRILSSLDTHFLQEQDFSAMLHYKLLSEKEQGFSDYADCSAQLSNRIVRLLPGYTDCNSFCALLKSKDVTYTRISRVLLHILLNLRKEDYKSASACGYAPYLRLLGFRKDAAKLFTQIKKRASRPLIAKPSRDAQLLSSEADRLFRRDIFASNLYYGTLSGKSGHAQKNELERALVIL